MNLRSVSRYVRDGRVPRWRRWVLVGGLLYTVMPVDLVPDVIPILGWLDDVGVLGLAVAWFFRDVARHEQARATEVEVEGVARVLPAVRSA